MLDLFMHHQPETGVQRHARMREYPRDGGVWIVWAHFLYPHIALKSRGCFEVGRRLKKGRERGCSMFILFHLFTWASVVFI